MFFFGALSLLITAWMVSDTLPGAERSWWAATFFVLGLLYGGLMQALLGVQEGPAKVRDFLLFSLALNLAPFAVVIGLASWGVWETAYHVYAWWMWGTLALCAVMTLGGAVYRALNPEKETGK